MGRSHCRRETMLSGMKQYTLHCHQKFCKIYGLLDAIFFLEIVSVRGQCAVYASVGCSPYTRPLWGEIHPTFYMSAEKTWNEYF